MNTNPFKPNSPVNPGMFVGRAKEIERLESALVQTCNEEPAHFMITGERGIGKTSLLIYFDFIAKGEIPVNDIKYNFLVLNLDIDQNTTQIGLLQRIQTHLDNELGKSEKARKFLKDTWAFIQSLQIMDSGIHSNEKTECDEVVFDKFILTLAKVINRICDKKTDSTFDAHFDGVVLLFDEADNCNPELNIGSFFKLILERLQRQRCNRLLIGLAGLPEIRGKLHVSHPSALRIFEEINLGRLTNTEVKGVIDLCMKRTSGVIINSDAKATLCTLSEGYPHFIQQFGASAFSHNTDGIIDEKDVISSALGPGGALELIGNTYYRNDYYNKISQESYRQVLTIMADNLDDWVTKAEIASKFKGKSSTLDNAIKALRSRHIIISKEGVKGVYRLQHKGFALWIKLQAIPLTPKSNK